MKSKAYEVEYKKIGLDDSTIKNFIKEVEDQRDRTGNWTPAPESHKLNQPRQDLHKFDYFCMGILIGISLSNIVWIIIFEKISG